MTRVEIPRKQFILEADPNVYPIVFNFLRRKKRKTKVSSICRFEEVNCEE